MPGSKIVWVGGRDPDRETLTNLIKATPLGEVTHASVDEALALLESRALDVLLVDVSQAGADVLKLLQAAAPSNGTPARVPVIVTAPATSPDRVQACLSRGAEEYITTPIDPKNPLLVTRRLELILSRKRQPQISIQTRGTDPDETAVLQLVTDASARFVPQEFLDNLDRKTIAEVKLGDHVQRDMTVLFTDIRDFTALSEQLTPQQNFNFLNSYLKHVTPIIRNHHGFIDKYIGDAVMALFPDKASDAITASIEVLNQVNRYNAGRRRAGYVPIEIGIGMHRGDLILGTVGEGNRMQTTVIADAVNVASRIEGLTKTFGVPLLLSKAVLDAVEDSSKYKLRHLGAVKAKGKKHSVEVYECFNTDPLELREHKEATAEQFEAAMNEFRKGMFLSAGKVFSRIAEMNKDDTVAAYYRDRCTLTVVSGRKGEWDGAESIEVK
ncbi:MAG: adenylate/guanylate cyclase domain-containing protein [Vulcanimicrobiaceae bacterium]